MSVNLNVFNTYNNLCILCTKNGRLIIGSSDNVIFGRIISKNKKGRIISLFEIIRPDPIFFVSFIAQFGYQLRYIIYKGFFIVSVFLLSLSLQQLQVNTSQAHHALSSASPALGTVRQTSIKQRRDSSHSMPIAALSCSS